MVNRVLVSLTALSLTWFGGQPVVGQEDFSSLPPDPSEVVKALAASKVTIAKAVEAAEAESKGKAVNASIKLVGGKLEILVEVWGDKLHKQMKVDPESGKVVSSEDLPTSRFPGEPVTGEPKTTDSGLMYYEIKEGKGDSPQPENTVSVHYTGWLTTGKKFDSSHDRGQPAKFPLNRVIKGWTEGVGAMKPGGKRKLIIPASLGYGESGGGPIPGNAMLIFDVELLEIVASPAVPGRPAAPKPK